MKSWKTTILGGLTAVFIAVQPLIETGEINWKAVGVAALVALFGFIAKDADVSGK